jgi:hypothetical protein
VKSLEERIKTAQTASTEELWSAIRESHPEVILGATLNRNLTESMAVFIARSTHTPAEALGFLAGDVRFKDSYKLKLAICKNPKTPHKITFSLLKFLRIYDLSDITRTQHIPVNIRQKIENDIGQRIPSLPSGNKIALARRANSTVILMLLEHGDFKVVSTCLDSPALTEGHLARVINKSSSTPHVIRMIAGHPKWSLRYLIKYALIRNFHTPMVLVTRFIGEMKTADLRDLYCDPKVPTSTKPYIFKELSERDEEISPGEEETYTLSEDEDSQLFDSISDEIE